MQVYILLSCNKCKWFRKCKGTTEELKDLVEHKSCVNCHGPRKFKCPKCANIIKSRRIQQDDPPELKQEVAPSDPQLNEKADRIAENPILASPATSTEELARQIGRLLAKRLRGES